MPLVTAPDRLAAGEDRVALARDAALGERERRQLLGGAVGARRGDRLGADEARLLLAAPAEPGLDRVAVGARGRCRRGESRPRAAACRGRRGRPARRRRRAARPRAPARARARSGSRPRPRPCSRCRRRAPRRRPRRASPCACRAGSSPSTRSADDRARVAGPGRRASRSRRGGRRPRRRSRRRAREPGEVALVVGGVGDRQVAVVGEPVGEQVVEHAAVLAAEDRVLGAADLELARRRWRAGAAAVERARARRSRSRPCARRRRRRSRSAPRGARRGRPRTGPASPSPRTGPASRRRRRARRTEGCA